MKKLSGLSACGGLAAGIIACVPEKPVQHIPVYPITVQDLPAEKKRLETALCAAQAHITALLTNHAADESQPPSPERSILETQQLMLHDESFLSSVYEHIETRLHNAESALKDKLDEAAALLTASGDPYLCGRAVDIQDSFEPVFSYLLSKQEPPKPRLSGLPQRAILAARSIQPSEVLLLRELNPIAILTEEGSTTSHIAIIARAWNIPMLVGIPDLMYWARTGMPAILDGTNQELTLEPEPAQYHEVVQQYEALHSKEHEAADYACVYTKDGTAVSLFANIAFAEDAAHSPVQHTAGIGLFRSEFLFLGKNTIPDEEQQYTAYKAILELMEDKPVIIRTFDAGADKMLAEQSARAEKNPLLGWRAVRYCLDRPDIFKTQLKALVRASAYGNLHILVPMVSCVEEIQAVKELLHAVQEECRMQGIAYKQDIPLGIMVEVPAIAAAADLYAGFADFFSIGTNDLVQYTMAADRENAAVAHLADYFQPAVLRLLEHTLKAASLLSKKGNGFISLCGEMAAQKEAVPVLLGMGLRHLSMNIQSIPAIKQYIETISLSEAEQLAAAIRPLHSAAAVRKTVQEYFPL